MCVRGVDLQDFSLGLRISLAAIWCSLLLHIFGLSTDEELLLYYDSLIQGQAGSLCF